MSAGVAELAGPCIQHWPSYDPSRQLPAQRPPSDAHGALIGGDVDGVWTNEAKRDPGGPT